MGLGESFLHLALWVVGTGVYCAFSLSLKHGALVSYMSYFSQPCWHTVKAQPFQLWLPHLLCMCVFLYVCTSIASYRLQIPVEGGVKIKKALFATLAGLKAFLTLQ